MEGKEQPVEIHEYDPTWPNEFMRIGTALRSALGETALRIDHIGSTSVEHLAAKPIIDIQVSVRSLEPIDVYLGMLENLGYVWRRDNPERTKRYFREAPGAQRTHIHVRRFGSWHEQWALLFRDYVRCHADDRQEYEQVKRALASRYRDQRKLYVDAKAPIFWGIIQKADRWAADTGWEPGPSDA